MSSNAHEGGPVITRSPFQRPTQESDVAGTSQVSNDTASNSINTSLITSVLDRGNLANQQGADTFHTEPLFSFGNVSNTPSSHQAENTLVSTQSSGHSRIRSSSTSRISRPNVGFVLTPPSNTLTAPGTSNGRATNTGFVFTPPSDTLNSINPRTGFVYSSLFYFFLK